MAKFTVNWGTNDTYLIGENTSKDVLSTDDVLECLRPAAINLVDYYKQTIRRLFNQRTGSFAESIDFDDTVVSDYAFIQVKPFGTHKGGKYTRNSRAGSAERKYAKHNRRPATKAIKNEELGYLLEYGTPRISPGYHWMESTNEEVAEEIQSIVEDEYTKLLKKKGLI